MSIFPCDIADSSPGRNEEWSALETDILRTRWKEKVPASLIAEELDRSKNSVIGRANRLKLEPRISGWPTGRREKIKTAIKNREIKIMPKIAEPPMEAAEPVEAEIYVPGAGKSLLDLEHGECRWPINTPARGEKYCFCAEQQATSNPPYCECHLRKAFSEDAYRRMRVGRAA